MAKSKSPALPDSAQVTAHIQKLDKKQAAIVQYVRQVILSADKEIGEQIKWNSPSFYYTGNMKEFNPKEYRRDIVVMNLHKGRVLLIFPTGAKIDDKPGLLEGDFKDGRRMVTIKDLEDAKEKEGRMKEVIKDWLEKVEK